MACRIAAKKSCSSPLLGVVPSQAAQTAFAPELSKAITFLSYVLLVKLHIRTPLIESFQMTFWSWWCAEEKLHFTPVHTLRQLKCDKALFPPLGRVVEFRARYRQIPVRGFWGVGKIWKRCDLRSRSYKRFKVHTQTDTQTRTPGD